jgi:glycerophosphoryl diester phosphodiesterase
MWLDLVRPVVIAHRGASLLAPENTMAAFELACKLGAPAIEFDVKLSADGQVVIIHDQTVDRTTNGKGRVDQLPLAALRELDAGCTFAGKYTGEHIPTLEELFERIGKKIYMNIELTNYATPFDSLVDRVAALIRKHSLESRVLFSSFFPINLIRARRLLPRVPRGQLLHPGFAGAWQRLASRLFNVQAEHPYTADVSERTVLRMHARGHRVHVWTVNDSDEMRRLLSLGVDGLFTDDPELALQVSGGG